MSRVHRHLTGRFSGLDGDLIQAASLEDARRPGLNTPADHEAHDTFELATLLVAVRIWTSKAGNCDRRTLPLC